MKGSAFFKIPAAKFRLAMAARGKSETIVAVPSKELGVIRQSLHRQVGPAGKLQEDGRKLLELFSGVK